jgi:hypothetical protein
MIIAWDQEGNIGGSELWKDVLSSVPDKDGICSSEAEHDRGTAPSPKLSVSKERLQKGRPEIRQPVLRSVSI